MSPLRFDRGNPASLQTALDSLDLWDAGSLGRALVWLEQAVRREIDVELDRRVCPGLGRSATVTLDTGCVTTMVRPRPNPCSEIVADPADDLTREYTRIFRSGVRFQIELWADGHHDDRVVVEGRATLAADGGPDRLSFAGLNYHCTMEGAGERSSRSASNARVARVVGLVGFDTRMGLVSAYGDAA